MNKPSDWIAHFPWPKREGHKYDRGHVLVVGGPMEKAGAAKLSALAALRTGAGLVSIICQEEDCIAYSASALSVMTMLRGNWESALKDERILCCVIGPGAGVTSRTADDVLALLSSKKQLVVDADALTVFADKADQLFNSLRPNCILTPHAGEFKRLFPTLVELPRESAARAAAKRANAVVIFKGAETIIAAPDGRLSINTSAPAELATAGTGDVLTGICAGLLAQGMEAFDAACAGVWMHSEAGAMFGAGLISEDLLTMLPQVLKQLRSYPHSK